MHLISTLCAGVAGASNGWAEIYVRGTSTRATTYPDFEASTSNSSGANITLDAYGAVEVYVNQLVDVVAKSPDGTVVRSWTDGYASPNVEVISPSFTGNDYVSGAAAVNEPTTLQSVLNLWSTNAGAPDWKVDISGTATTIENAFGSIVGLFFNVKSPAYGAVGDGVTNDQGAIQAALAAAVAAGGGTVFFPAGTYLISTAIEWDHRVNAIGSGSWATKLITNSAVNARTLTLTTGTAQTLPCIISGLAFDATQTNTGEQFYSSVAVNIKFVGCEFGDSAFCTGDLVKNFSGGGTMTFDTCRFTAYGGHAATLQSDATLIDCRFFTGTALYNKELLRVSSKSGLVAASYVINGCRFDASTVTSAPTSLHGILVASGIAYVSVSDCHFISTGSQLFVSGIRGISQGYLRVTGGSYVGCTTKFSTPTCMGSGSFLDTSERVRTEGATNAYTLSDGVSLHEIISTGTAPTLTVPAALFPSQRMGVYLFNSSGGNWAAVSFSGSYYSLVSGSTATNNGQAIFLEFVVTDLSSAGSYIWHIVDVRVA